MSELHLAQIRRHLEEQFLPHLDLEGASQDHHQLSRAVAALALVERAGLSPSLSAQQVTDHTKDQGIDAAAYAADRSTLVLVQSKWTSTGNGPSHGDVLKFLDGVRALINNNWEGFAGPILSRRREITDILSQPGTQVELVLATSSTAQLAEQQADAMRTFCAEMNDSTEIARFAYLDQQRLYKTMASSKDNVIDLNVNLRNWGTHQEAGAVAYYGTASAQEVVGWYEAHGPLLFSRNIRGALSGTEVNSQIAHTATEDPARFWFFNNGITVVAESFKQAPHVNQKSGSFSFRHASVVNGAQTISSIAHAASVAPELLQTADVFVRFVTLEDPEGEFGRLVTRRTNTQNQVGGREFVALDPEQERIRLEFAVSGFRYAYRAGETVADTETGCDLTEATVALACTAGLREVVLAKREIGQLWEDINSAPYKTLFNASVSGAQVWTAVELMRWVDEDLRNLRESELDGRDWLVAVHGNRLVLWAVLNKLGSTKIRAATSFGGIFDRDEVRVATEELGHAVVGIVAQHFADSYPQPLFKSQTKVRTVADLLAGAPVRLKGHITRR